MYAVTFAPTVATCRQPLLPSHDRSILNPVSFDALSDHDSPIRDRDNAAVNGTTYFYKVSAVNAVGEGGFSNELSAVPAGSPTVPDAPSGLTATALSRSLIGLGWTDNAANETGFRIERSFDGSSGWRQVGSVAANATTYLHWRHWPLTTSFYRVRATNAAGHSTYSNVASATTLG